MVFKPGLIKHAYSYFIDEIVDDNEYVMVMNKFIHTIKDNCNKLHWENSNSSKRTNILTTHCQAGNLLKFQNSNHTGKKNRRDIRTGFGMTQLNDRTIVPATPISLRIKSQYRWMNIKPYLPKANRFHLGINFQNFVALFVLWIQVFFPHALIGQPAPKWFTSL
jgi:hypothetical protein